MENPIPEFSADLDTILKEIGYLYLYHKQMQAQCVRLAAEVNKWHDESEKLQKEVDELRPSTQSLTTSRPKKR